MQVSKIYTQNIIINIEDGIALEYGIKSIETIEIDTPDGGQIADFILSEIDIPEVKLFLLLIERKRIEPWSDNSEPVSFQEFIEIKLQKSIHKNKFNKLKKRGCVWKNKLAPKILQEIITENPAAPLSAVAKKLSICLIKNFSLSDNLLQSFKSSE